MDTRREDWNEIIENGLSREVPGGLTPELRTQIEARVERERALPPSRGDDPVGALAALFAAWLVIAVSLILLHLSATPDVYEALLTSSRSIIQRVRIDLIAAAIAALLLTEAAARLIHRRRHFRQSRG